MVRKAALYTLLNQCKVQVTLQKKSIISLILLSLTICSDFTCVLKYFLHISTPSAVIAQVLFHSTLTVLL